MIYSRLCSTLCSPYLVVRNFIFFATEKDPSLHNEYKSSKKSKEKSHHHHRSDKHEGGSTEHRERSEDRSEKGHRSVEKSSKHDKSHHKSGEKSHQKSSGDHHHHHHKKHKDHREHKDKVIIIIRRETTENTMIRLALCRIIGGRFASMTRCKMPQRHRPFRCQSSVGTVSLSNSFSLRSPTTFKFAITLEPVSHRDPESPGENKMPFYIE